MAKKTKVKFCGLRQPGDIAIANHLQVDAVGFVCLASSKRQISLSEAAGLTGELLPEIKPIVLAVNPSLEALAEVKKAGFSHIQLHGEEGPDFVKQIALQLKLKIWKAFSIETDADLDQINAYLPWIDAALIDAKAQKNSEQAGGHGTAFDWELLKSWEIPTQLTEKWWLAGGLHAQNIARAVALTNAPGVDVSSGIECRPGVKDEGRMRSFVEALRRSE